MSTPAAVTNWHRPEPLPPESEEADLTVQADPHLSAHNDTIRLQLCPVTDATCDDRLTIALGYRDAIAFANILRIAIDSLSNRHPYTHPAES